jgi:deoxyadenosine/deoxycytidine kinase
MKIAVGGMIASGKSTLVDSLAKKFNLNKMDEFDDGDEVFNTLLKWLYEGKENVEMLLQIYFLHKHWYSQKKLKGDTVVDRHIIEHWLFAQINLQKFPEVLNMYNGLFHQYMTTIEQPKHYIILDVNWVAFEERIMKRGRPSERDNFTKNYDYFKNLLDHYTTKMVAQCQIYDIPYTIIDTSNLTAQEVLDKASGIVEKFI